MDTDNGPFVDLFTMADKQPPAFLQIEQGITQCLAGTVGYQNAVDSLAVFCPPSRNVMRKNTVDQPGTLGAGKKLGAKADQSA